MKKFMSIVVFILVILFVNIQFASAASIGLRPTLTSKNYVALDSSLLLSIPNISTYKIPWDVSISSKFRLSPTSYIRLSNSTSQAIFDLDTPSITEISNITSFNYSYLLGNNIVFDLHLYVNLLFSNGITGWAPEFKLSQGGGTLALSMEYLFLNRPTYQAGLNVSASIGAVYISMLGGVDIFNTLELRGSIGLNYTYLLNVFHTTFSMNLLYKKDLLIANLSYVRGDLSNQVDLDVKDTLLIALSSRLPIIEKLTAVFDGYLELNNILFTTKAPYMPFYISAGAEYAVTSDLSLTLSYKFKRSICMRTILPNPATTYYNYAHVISLGAKYTF